ncbi:MAG: hypothetical protein Q8J78_09960, partial [Moraxellaceae bacterium]|nr:hypothetical protein [Moraxellaceae bacterium]
MTGLSGISSAAQVQLPRTDLLRLLDQSREFVLTLLLAPAGSGKSTLLREWLQSRPPATSVQLALDAGDADPVRFFRRFGRALRAAVPGFDTAFYNHLSAQIDLPAIAVVEALEQAFANCGPLTVVLDDFQHARSPLIQQVVSLLLDRLPAHVHFVLATRQYPDFSLSRLKLDNRLLLIDSHDLRLNHEHVTALASSLQLDSMDTDTVAHLLALTEGWMAGIKIALLAQARTGRQAMGSFNGRQPELVDYFAHAVLRDLPDTLHEFMLCTAALGQFNADLCNAVLQRKDSERLINDIRQQALFLQETSEHSDWFRYHPLFQDFLESRLRIEMPDRIVAIHESAATHLMRHGEPEMAVLHAQRGSASLFRKVLGECCAQWLRSGDFNAIIHWVKPLPDDLVVSEGDLILPLIGALIFSRRFNQARYYLDALKNSASANNGRFADDSTPVFLEIMLLLFQHDTDFHMHADHAVLLTSCQHHDIRAFGLAILAYHHLLRADFVQAMQYGLQAKAVLGQLGYEYLESYADLILILCDRSSGNLHSAVQRSEALMARFRSQRQSPAWINASVSKAVVRYEQNRLDEARHICEELIPLVSSACATEVIVYTYLTLSRLLDMKGEYARAARLTQQLHSILKLGNYERLTGHLACEEVLHALRHGQPELMERANRQHRLESRLAESHWK